MKLIRPVLHPKCNYGESPASYLHRIAKLNYYDSFRWSLEGCKAGSISLAALYELLDQNLWTGFDRTHPFTNLKNLSYRYFQTPRIKVCPECISDKGYWDYNAHAVLSPICIEHNRWKMDRCPGCGVGYSWWQGSIERCSCYQVRSSSPDRPPIHAFELAMFIEGVSDQITLGLDAGEFSYKSRCDLFLLFASNLRIKKRAGSFPRYTEVADLKDDWEAVGKLLSNDDSLLDEFYRTLNNAKPSAFKKFYRNFMGYDQPSLSSCRDKLIQFISGELKTPISGQHRCLRSNKPTSNIWEPLQTVSREFNVPKSVLNHMMEIGKVKFQKRVFNKREQTLIFIDSKEGVKNMINQYINFNEAIQMLGVTKQQLYTIINSGFLKDISRPRECHSSWLISSTEIESLKEKLHAHKNEGDSDSLTIAHALSFYSMGFEDLLPLLLQAIIDGQIRVVSSTERREIRNISIDKDEFILWKKARLEASDKISIVDLAKRFGINQESMYQIVNAGLIKAEDNGKNRLNRLISEDEIVRFKNKYALLSKIAWALNRNPRYMKGRIEMYRVYPINHEMDIDLRQTIYLRSDLDKCIELGYLLLHRGDWSFDEGNELAA